MSLREQLLVIAGASPSSHLLHYRLPIGGQAVSCYWPISKLDKLARELPRLGTDRTVYLACAPRARHDGGCTGVERVECLWADCDTDESLTRLARFRPLPSLLVASGGLTASGQRNLHAYWRLWVHVDADTADKALKRVQRRLGSDSQCAEPARVLRPIGSTWRKDGQVRPVELVSVDLAAVYPIEEVLADTEPLRSPEPPLPRARPKPRAVARGAGIGALAAALKAIPPPVYVPALTGREPNHAKKIACPFHDDWNPSFHVYETAEEGWACFQCDNDGRPAGGTIVDLAARLYGMDARRDYLPLLRRLAEELLS